MSDSCCFQARRPPRAGWRRCGELAGWIVPGVALALVPKCPACLAAYIALATGVGVSASSAGHFRTGLIAACLGAITCLASRRILRMLPRARGLGP